MKNVLGIILLLLVKSGFSQSNINYPKDNWMKYKNIEESGWSSQKMALAKSYYDSIASSALMIVDRNGVVVVAWGEYEREFITHSVRKSFMSGLIGRAIMKNQIDLNTTLGELNIQSKEPLTNKEKTATVQNLLQARSGVYRRAAAETPHMDRTRPQKEQYKPGEYWYYNNWDFNVLGTILKQKTGLNTFEYMLKEIAEPLNMEDYSTSDGVFHSGFRNEFNLHPAYMMKMSARDMARFGLLYLSNGVWEGKQLLTKKWVQESIFPHSHELPAFSSLNAKYGYLWWLYDNPKSKEFHYEAAGAGGHYISIFPNAGFLVVQRVNTYDRNRVNHREKEKLYKLILSAKEGEPSKRADLVILEPQKKNYTVTSVSKEKLSTYAKPYIIGNNGEIEVKQSKNKLFIRANFLLFEELELLPIAEHSFLIEGFEMPVKFEVDKNGAVTQIFIGEDNNPRQIIGKVKTE